VSLEIESQICVSYDMPTIVAVLITTSTSQWCYTN